MRLLSPISSRKASNIAFILLFLLGIMLSGYRARSVTPEWPEDLVVYMSGFMTAEMNQNPYDENLARSIAAERGLILGEAFGYIYTPAFLLVLEPLGVLNPDHFKRLWQYSSLLACWLGVLLLIRRLRDRRNTLLLALLVMLLSIGGPVIATLRWGQISGFLFLFLCVAISRNMRGVISGLALCSLPVTKVGMALPLIALRGKRAWVGLASAIVFLGGISFFLYYNGIWESYFTELASSAKDWNMSIPGNRSLFASVSRLVDISSTAGMDSASLDRAARVAFSENVAASVRIIGIGISLSYLVVCFGVVTKWFRHRPRFDAVFLAVWLAWISIALVPMIYDHYALFMLPLVVEVFRRGKKRYSVLILLGFAWWTLAPMTQQGHLSSLLWVLYEAIRPMIVLSLGLLMLKVIPLRFNHMNSELMNDPVIDLLTCTLQIRPTASFP